MPRPTVQVTWGPGWHVPAGASLDEAAYEDYIGRWSRLFVPVLLEAADVAVGQHVLDVATGPGDVAAAALKAVGQRGVVVACDIAPAMLDAAQRRFGAPLRVLASDAQTLACRDTCFDAVLCQLGLMFVDDLQAVVAEMHRVLRPGGRLAFGVISTPERAPMWGVLAEILGEHLPTRRTTLQRAFSLAEPERVVPVLQGAGFEDIQWRRETRSDHIESMDDYWRPIERGIGLLPQAYCSLPAAQRRVVRAEVNKRFGAFLVDGRLYFTLELLVGRARRTGRQRDG